MPCPSPHRRVSGFDGRIFFAAVILSRPKGGEGSQPIAQHKSCDE
jgi:hypothetical protein